VLEGGGRISVDDYRGGRGGGELNGGWRHNGAARQGLRRQREEKVVT
jgi:hypothetical protein